MGEPCYTSTVWRWKVHATFLVGKLSDQARQGKIILKKTHIRCKGATWIECHRICTVASTCDHSNEKFWVPWMANLWTTKACHGEQLVPSEVYINVIRQISFHQHTFHVSSYNKTNKSTYVKIIFITILQNPDMFRSILIIFRELLKVSIGYTNTCMDD